MMRDTRQQTLGFTLLAAGVAAAAGFIGTAELVRRRATHATDHKVRRKVPHHATVETPEGRVIERAQKLGKWWMQVPISALASAVLWRSGHRRAGAAITLASASSALMANFFDEVLFHRPPPPGHPNPETPSFPSGHALQLAAVSLTAGYVLTRERLAPAAIAVPLALGIPLASSGTRLYQDRHWASDVLGGWVAAIALASWCSAGYELVPEARLAAMSRTMTRQARRGAQVAERTVTRTVERAADRVRELPMPGRRTRGLMDIVKLIAEDVFARQH